MSINRNEYLRSTAEQFFHEHNLEHEYVYGPCLVTATSANAFANFITRTMRRTTIASMNYTILYDTLSELNHPRDVHCTLEHHNDIFRMLTLTFSPSVILIVAPILPNCPPVSDDSLRKVIDTPFYDI